jgi:DinB family protein
MQEQSPITVEEVITVLERTPGVLDAWLRDLPESWSDVRTEGPESFSPRDNVGHLISGERTDWIARTRMILDRGEQATFVPFDRFAFRREIEGRPLGDLLDEFAALRRENLAVLRGFRLQAADFARRGRHPGLGSVTLSQLLATWAVHDLGHIAQVARVMAKRYTLAVGPWVDYLPVLTR